MTNARITSRQGLDHLNTFKYVLVISMWKSMISLSVLLMAVLAASSTWCSRSSTMLASEWHMSSSMGFVSWVVKATSLLCYKQKHTGQDISVHLQTKAQVEDVCDHLTELLSSVLNSLSGLQFLCSLSNWSDVRERGGGYEDRWGARKGTKWDWNQIIWRTDLTLHWLFCSDCRSCFLSWVHLIF